MRSKKSMNDIDTPYEKIRRGGARALSDFELFKLLFVDMPDETALTAAKKMQKIIQNDYTSKPIAELAAISDVSESQVIRAVVSLEIAKRHLIQKTAPLTSMHDILIRLADLRKEKQERLVCLSFDGGSRLIAQRTITIGILDELIAHPREVFADPIADRSSHVIIAHNHPSGDPRPSSQDVALTQQLAASGRVLGIPVKDHIILTETDMYSFRQNQLL